MALIAIAWVFWYPLLLGLWGLGSRWLYRKSGDWETAPPLPPLGFRNIPTSTARNVGSSSQSVNPNPQHRRVDDERVRAAESTVEHMPVRAAESTVERLPLS